MKEKYEVFDFDFDKIKRHVDTIDNPQKAIKYIDYVWHKHKENKSSAFSPSWDRIDFERINEFERDMFSEMKSLAEKRNKLGTLYYYNLEKTEWIDIAINRQFGLTKIESKIRKKIIEQINRIILEHLKKGIERMSCGLEKSLSKRNRKIAINFLLYVRGYNDIQALKAISEF